jgi:ferredoxin-NADP reductase
MAVLRSSEEQGAETRLLTFSLAPAEQLPFVGGKYIIVDTGLLLADGKIRKRAYTLISYDATTASFQIAVRHVGVATEYLHAMIPGEQLRFSGPWGKYVPHAPDANEKIWIIATDTGITVALGLLQAAQLSGRLGSVELSWWLTAPDYFLSKEFVTKRLGNGLAKVEVLTAHEIGDPRRIAEGQAWIMTKIRTERPTRVYLSGDGAVVLPWIEILTKAGVAGDRIHVETFFNHAKSKP